MDSVELHAIRFIALLPCFVTRPVMWPEEECVEKIFRENSLTVATQLIQVHVTSTYLFSPVIKIHF